MKRLLTRLTFAVGLAAPLLAAHADDQVKRGEYLARAADCMACHTAPGGAPFAGGGAGEVFAALGLIISMGKQYRRSQANRQGQAGQKKLHA